MFERSRAGSLIDRVCVTACEENRAAAENLVAIYDVYRARLRESDNCDDWAIDTIEQVVAEIVAALRIGPGVATNRVTDAIAMHTRLPEVGKVFLGGEMTYLTFRTIVERTDLVTDEDRLAAVDAEIARKALGWPGLSRSQLIARVDRIVVRHDRDGKRRRQKKRDDRWVDIWDSGDGVSEIRGFLRVMDGRAFNARLDAMAASVCPNDPRSHAQRRADAFGALAAGEDRLACECDRSDCTAGDKPVSPVTMYFVANADTVEGSGDTPGHLIDSVELFPPDLVVELARTAKRVPIVHPGDAPAECRYTASQQLADFVRCRDLTCRFPGCDRPAVGCDVDHTVPYQNGGPTQASNLKCLCRTHHLLKTFAGWRDKQLRDGTIIWTSPSGDTYVTVPGSALLFPSLCAPTAAVTRSTAAAPESTDRTAMVPKRRRTRAENRALRVAAERRLNRQDREVELGRRQWEEALAMAHLKDEPPPF